MYGFARESVYISRLEFGGVYPEASSGAAQIGWWPYGADAHLLLIPITKPVRGWLEKVLPGLSQAGALWV